MADQLARLISNGNGFTGYDHTRLLNLLAFLAALSIVVWGMVIVSIMLRFGARAFLGRKDKHPYVRSRT